MSTTIQGDIAARTIRTLQPPITRKPNPEKVANDTLINFINMLINNGITINNLERPSGTDLGILVVRGTTDPKKFDFKAFVKSAESLSPCYKIIKDKIVQLGSSIAIIVKLNGEIAIEQLNQIESLPLDIVL